MRFLYHVALRADVHAVVPGGAGVYAPASLEREGFVHASFFPSVRESAQLYFPKDADLAYFQLDPRRLDATIEIAETPRGPMPHVHGPIPVDAIRDVTHTLDTAEDRVTGTRYVFVAFAGMTLLDLVGTLDPISRIASMGFDPKSNCEIVSATDGADVWSGHGCTLHGARVRPLLTDADVLVVSGGPAASALSSDASVVEWLAAYPPNRLATSVCSGALLLGAAGFLRDRRATTHASAMHKLSAFGAIPTHERVVTDGPRMTSGGVTAGIDLGLAIVARIEGEETARAIAKQMEYEVR